MSQHRTRYKQAMDTQEFLNDARMRQRIVDTEGFSEEARRFLAMKAIDFIGHLAVHRVSDLGKVSRDVLRNIEATLDGQGLKLGLSLWPQDLLLPQIDEMLRRAIATTAAGPALTKWNRRPQGQENPKRPRRNDYGRPRPRDRHR